MTTATLADKGSTPSATTAPAATEPKATEPATKPAASAADVAAKLAPAGETPPADSGQKETTTPGTPTVYDLKLPDQPLLKPEQLEPLKALAAESKLAPEAAQKFADYAHSLVVGQAEAAVASLAQEEAAMEAASRADPHLGGARFDAVTAKIGKVLDEFFPEIAADVKSSFWMKEPRARLGFARLAAAMAEGGAPVRGAETRAPEDPAATFFPKMIAAQQKANK